MNICLVTSSYPINADDFAAPMALPFLRELEQRGHRTVVVTPAKSGAPVGWDADEKVFRFQWRSNSQPVVNLKPTSPANLARIASLLWNGKRALLRVIETRAIDTCLALWAIPSGYLAWQARNKTGVPFAIWALGSDINMWGRWPLVATIVRQTIREADALFADGLELARQVQQMAGKDCHFISTARTIDLDQAAPVELEPGVTHFLFVGRWELVKGIDVLLQAFYLLVQEQGYYCARLHVFGSGSLESTLRRFVVAHQLDDVIEFLPNAPTAILYGYLQKANCLVIPSRSDTVALVFTEALQAHLPLIVSDVGDMGYVSREYGVARVVPPEDPLALKMALAEFIEKGQPASPRRQEFLDRMDLRTSATRYLDVMSQIVKKP